MDQIIELYESYHQMDLSLKYLVPRKTMLLTLKLDLTGKQETRHQNTYLILFCTTC